MAAGGNTLDCADVHAPKATTFDEIHCRNIFVYNNSSLKRVWLEVQLTQRGHVRLNPSVVDVR